MTGSTEASAALRAWLAIPASIEKAIDGLGEDDLDLRDGGLSIRETVHHLVEANLVASNIMIAGLAKSGCTYDWSWVTPDAAWMQRVGYDSAPVRPALCHAPRLVCAHRGFDRGHVGRVPARGAAPRCSGRGLYSKTVQDLLMQEVEHAAEHLRTLAQTRVAHGR